MKHSLSLASVSIVCLLALLTVACGQKPNVALQASPVAGKTVLPPGTTVDAEGNVVDAEGNVIGTAEEFGLTDGSTLASGDTTTGSTDTDTNTNTDTDTDTNTNTNTDTDTNTSPGEPTGGDATGVSGTTIKIGIHAPLTGAAPVPSDSVQKGKDLYYKWLQSQGKSINGRNVEVILEDDQYNPSHAVAVCKQMVERDKVFFLSGAAGTDQIWACARYAESQGIPYIGAGVTESGLSSLRMYFSLSVTYPDQGPLLAQLLANKLGAKSEKNGMLFFDTPNFYDAHKGFKDAFQRMGGTVHYDRMVSKGADARTATTVVQEMQAKGIENVYVLTSPVWWIEVLKAANAQGYRPQWVGIGISMTFDAIVRVACGSGNSINGAKFFSPFPAVVDSNKFDPAFRQASQKFYPDKTPDDFMWLQWSASKTWAQMLALPGKSLTRERFVYHLEQAKPLQNGIGPALDYSPTSHFGAKQVHVSEARCSDRMWHTLYTWRSSF